MRQEQRTRLILAAEALSRGDNHLVLLAILELLEDTMVDISKLQSDVEALQAAGVTASDELGTLVQQVQTLQEAGAGNVTQQQLDDLAAAVEGVTSTVSAAVTSAQGTTPSPAPPTPAPAPTPSPTPTPAPPPPTTGTAQQALYTFSGGDFNTLDQAEQARWHPSGLQDPTGNTLYYFADDVIGGVPTGQSPEWHVYTGATQPAPSPSDSPPPAPPSPAAGGSPASPAEAVAPNVPDQPEHIPSDVPAGGGARDASEVQPGPSGGAVPVSPSDVPSSAAREDDQVEAKTEAAPGSETPWPQGSATAGPAPAPTQPPVSPGG